MLWTILIIALIILVVMAIFGRGRFLALNGLLRGGINRSRWHPGPAILLAIITVA